MEDALRYAAKSDDGLWVLTIPPANQQIRDHAIGLMKTITEDGVKGLVLPDSSTLTRVGGTLPQFTWDMQTPPPRKERRDDDPPYSGIRVNNSLTPIHKMGRLIRPLTAADDEFPVWEVDVEGTVREVHSPEEAWQ